tara:strand:+ start:1025 stop:1585 length:561 start_codon:yes stop_codon:yes gene_type:complete
MNRLLVVGLGNPGEKYKETRHNIGFKIMDCLCGDYAGKFTAYKYGDYAKIKIKGKSVHLLKPNTFMNLSGHAVRYYLLKHKIKTRNLLIVADDLHLPFGTIKLKPKGSAGGHNGHKDIINKLDTVLYPRLRFGVGNQFAQGGQSRYVLSNWSIEESLQIDKFINLAVDIISNFCTLGIDATMTEYN